MENSIDVNEYKKSKRKYELANILLRLAACILAIAAVFILFFSYKQEKISLSSYIAYLVVIVIVLFIVLLFAMLPITINLQKIISMDLNPWKLKYIIEKPSRLIKYTTDKYVMCDFFTADYQSVVNICTNELKKKRTANFTRLSCLNWLSYTYFVLGDMVNLLIACSKFDDIAAATKRNMSVIYPTQSLFALFAQGKHEELKKLYGSEDKSRWSNSRKYGYEYIHAVNFYKLGETEQAKQIFERIVAEAPLLNYCELSKNHLAAINEGKEYSVEPVILEPSEPNEAYKMADRYQKHGKIAKRIITYVLIALLVIALLIECSYEFSKKKYFNQLEDAAQEVHKDCELIDYFYIKKDGELIENVLLIKLENDKLEIGYAVQGETEDETIYVGGKEITLSGSVLSDSPCTDYYIMYKLYTNKSEIPEPNIYVHEFEMNKTTYYLCVVDLLTQ